MASYDLTKRVQLSYKQNNWYCFCRTWTVCVLGIVTAEHEQYVSLILFLQDINYICSWHCFCTTWPIWVVVMVSVENDTSVFFPLYLQDKTHICVLLAMFSQGMFHMWSYYCYCRAWLIWIHDIVYVGHDPYESLTIASALHDPYVSSALSLQGAALVHIYLDGSVLLTHGGIEMGQGLHIKMIQVPADHARSHDSVAIRTSLSRTPSCSHLHRWCSV